MTLDQRCTADSGVCETCGQVRHSLLYQHDTMLYVPRHDIHPYVPRPCGAAFALACRGCGRWEGLLVGTDGQGHVIRGSVDDYCGPLEYVCGRGHVMEASR